MDLNTLWFAIIAVLFAGYFVLEGFDFGVGMLMPFIGKDDTERRMTINTIAPFWDGNEVWLITAGGAMFAAFPHWYASMFSGFYIALCIMLLALIVRGISLEFRSKDERATWRKICDWGIFVGSALPPVLWGVAMANLLSGLEVDANFQLHASLFDLLSYATITSGVLFLFLFLLQGSLFLQLKLEKDLISRIYRSSILFAVLSLILVLLVDFSGLFEKPGALGVRLLWGLRVFSWVVLFAALLASVKKRAGWAFVFSTLAIISITSKFFLALYPRVLVSSIKSEWDLTIYNASSGSFTLLLMSYVALIFVPVIVLYQGWSYWVFRHRVTRSSIQGY